MTRTAILYQIVVMKLVFIELKEHIFSHNTSERFEVVAIGRSDTK